ncbi:MAG: ribonuclease HII [Drouetiella hepatica Uher 2000/2452]|uniref:Ribonuclease HII n=1 Tax=Drouetiella hepatica Uher 2000/2452 TaxID=904376 RepID=A0A951UKH4_9CYAN|nr:ribonuclease HII [Drouetiella hepatica Uher 2000/2452]
MKPPDFLSLSELLGSEADEAVPIAGVDEVGRGALFGPVIAAAVVLPIAAHAPLISAGVTDSKLLSAARRRQLAEEIRAVAIACHIGMASVREIDRLNILQATFLAMKRAIRQLQPQPALCLVDGNQRIPGLLVPQKTVVKGDQKSVAIAAASIVAKVWRDDLIMRLAARYPGYDLSANKGYGTAKHRLALQQQGISPQHRCSFSPCRLSGNNSGGDSGNNAQSIDWLSAH